MHANSASRRLLLLTIFLLCAWCAPAKAAAEQQTRLISSDELKTMLDQRKPFLLVDTRTREEYQEAHIVQAVSIPEKDFEKPSSLLPDDKDSLIVLYCNGVKCGKSKKAAKKAETMGYRNVLIYAEGFPVWEEKGFAIAAGPEYSKKIETTKIRPADLRHLIDTAPGECVLVDVRDADEFKEGHIPSAINIPVETFASRSEVLPKEKKIIVYCNSGGRSYTAYRKLMKLGYPSIAQSLLSEWKEAGMALER